MSQLYREWEYHQGRKLVTQTPKWSQVTLLILGSFALQITSRLLLICARVIQLLLLTGHLHLIKVWSGEDQRTKFITIHAQKRLDYIFKFQ